MLLKDPVPQKIIEVTAELKRAGLWKKQSPGWITDYEEKIIADEQDFLEWLQFIYLPNCLQGKIETERKLIAPQAIKYFGNDVRKGKLLQLLIELDSLS